MCRKDVVSWTTKKLVQLALNEQKQHEIQHKVSIPELKQHDEVPVAEQGQQEVSQKLNNTEGDTSKRRNYEICRFDSLKNILNCLEC